MRQVPEKLESHSQLGFLDQQDWERLYRIVKGKQFSPPSDESGRPAYPGKAEEQAAWEWIESFYGARVRAALYPSDRTQEA